MIIADTGFFLALANSADRFHERAKTLRGEINEGLVTTWPVVTETCHLLLHALGVRAMIAFIASAAGEAFEVWQQDRDSVALLPQLMKKYSDLPMDLADASLVLLAQKLGSGRILSTDMRDFRSYKWKSRKPFVNLMDK